MYLGPLSLLTNRCLETPGMITPTVAPESFCYHEVVGKALRCVYVECRFVVMACRASLLDPLWVSAFNAVGGFLIPPHQDALTMWYATTKPCRVSVLYIRVCDPGEVELSRRCCTGSTFGRVLISLTSRGHLTLAMTSHGSPRGTGV